METESYQLAVYLHLARASERRRRPLVRDRMLVLAGIQAANMNLYRLSQYCRAEIIEHNPRHLVGRWNSIAEALLDEEFATFAKSVSRRVPLERAEQMLDSLGIDISNERATYFDDLEYAAAILNIDPQRLSDANSDQ